MNSDNHYDNEVKKAGNAWGKFKDGPVNSDNATELPPHYQPKAVKAHLDSLERDLINPDSDNVEAKKPYMILDDAFTCGINLTAYDWPDYKDLKPGMLKALDKYYASKWLDKMEEAEYVAYQQGYHSGYRAGLYKGRNPNQRTTKRSEAIRKEIKDV